ncbi:gamma-aminobutyric acid type B receptor subunit 2-like isoform X2 [Limulus polyphemus]|uniref:Gamma-aminobutyric acid type B receptor subunit 2-like isoform X2 n=1 Tax=Limulus polyphemus TaxID=6850 RepID=A0ABM1B7W8_LIMPO|nr:gamma-aminobutyric acid type B receptor subunit 2-like isoform X2 [Limulus polyphemus]
MTWRFSVTPSRAHWFLRLGLCFVLQVVVAQPLQLQIGGFFPVSKEVPEGEIGQGVIPAVTLALEHINSSPHILPDYQLTIQWNDTKCDPAVGMKSFFDMLSEDPRKVVLFGDACTSVTDPIAKASQFFQLAQLTYGDTHPMYTVENYPNFFQIVPSETAFNPARVALLQLFNWSRVGTLYQSKPRYALPHSKLLSDLEAAEIEIAAQQGFVDELKLAISKLKEKDVRIILGNFDEHWARNVFCEAYKLGMYGRKYQWIIVGMYDYDWWMKHLDNLTCNQSQLREAMEGYLAVDILSLSSTEDITVSGLTSAEYYAQYKQHYSGSNNRFHGYAYDGIWVIALAIQMVKRKLLASGSSRTLEMFEYSDPFWGTLFREAFNKTSFIGVTGSVSFFRNERRGLVLLKQYQNGAEVKIGEYDSVSNTLKLYKDTKIIWNGANGPPPDRTLIVIQPSRISLTIYAIIVTFALLGIIMASSFLVINIRFRNQRYIKMSSPYLNNIIIVGCMLTYTSVILLGLDSSLTSEHNFPYICAARAWVLMNGFSLAFGSMFSKTWRVHAIFTNIKLNKKVIQDYKLFMVVGVLVLIDIAILTTWQVIDPFYRETSLGMQLPSSGNEDSVVIPELEFCNSQNMTVFLGSIYAYKGLLMAFGCFLAWETRHVSIPALNDSKYIGMSVYNAVIMCVIGAAISFVLREQQDAAFIIISIFIIFCSTTTLCLVFVPKLVELKRNPNAGDRRVRATLKPFKKSRRSSEDFELQSQIRLLQDENYRNRQKLEEKTFQLQTLIARLKEMEEPVIVITHGVTSPIPENSSDGNCEDIQVIVPSLRQHREVTVISRSPSPEEGLDETFSDQHSRRKLSSVSFKVEFALPAEEESSESSRKGSDSDTESPFAEGKDIQVCGSSLSHLCPLSFMDQVIRYMDSDSSSESSESHRHLSVKINDGPVESDNTPYAKAITNYPKYFQINDVAVESDDTSYAKAITNYHKHLQIKDVPLESDDTSYARAITNYHKRALMKSDSSSFEEDTDRCANGNISEESDSYRQIRVSISRRAKSFGALRSNAAPSSFTDGEVSASVIHDRGVNSQRFSPLLPYFSDLVTDQTQQRTGVRDVCTPLSSSFPSIKCDIVEYL